MQSDWQPTEPDDRRRAFATTRWSLVGAAGAGGAESQNALEALCRIYWPSIYAYARRFGQDEEAARDCTQDFFRRLIEKRWAADANRERGTFRTFLICRLKCFLADEWDRKTALKRGGGNSFISLDQAGTENAFQLDDIPSESPDLVYDRQWAFSVLRTSLERLREEFVLEGKTRTFEVLKCFVGGGEALPSYSKAATELNSTEAAMKMAVSRMRRRFRDIARAEVAQTVCNEEELEAEMAYLVEVLCK